MRWAPGDRQAFGAWRHVQEWRLATSQLGRTMCLGASQILTLRALASQAKLASGDGLPVLLVWVKVRL